MSVTTSTLNDVDLATIAGLAAAIEDDPAKATTNWRATVDWDGGFRTTARVRDFAPITSDEPAGLGGTDLGPNPVEQVLAALGNCLAVGYAANASARGIAIDALRIDIRGTVDLHSFLGLREGHAGFDDVAVTVDLKSSATKDAVAALHEHVLSTSPVGHTIGRAVPVRVELSA